MSSCFLCDCSHMFNTDNDRYSITYSEGNSEDHYMKYKPIFIGSSGTNVNDQQHNNNNNQNYVSYKVKKIEFRADCSDHVATGRKYNIPDYIIIFKIPFREIIFDYYFTIMKNFMLYSEPESVLKYGVYSYPNVSILPYPGGVRQKFRGKYDLIVDKPFIVGPNDYVGVLYMFSRPCYVNSSARVWFDIV